MIRTVVRASLRLLLVLALPLVGLVGCEKATPAEPPPEGTPRLVVLVVSDQFRFDYLERGRGLYTGGLKRLMDEGLSFTEAHHGHAVTSTGPGHASLATGTHPAGTGIVGNGWYQRPETDEVYVVDDPEFEVSPRNLKVSALGDWMKARYPESQVFAVSGKDRSAVLTGGHDADGAFWFDDENEGMVTSGYYFASTPGWLEALNDAGPPGNLLLEPWRPLPVAPVAAAAAGFRPFDRGPFESGFPHLVGGNSMTLDEDFLYSVYRTPFVDQWVASIGLGLVRARGLGQDEWPDLLSLSFSAVDTVGHWYGPNSLEVLDTLLRLDRVTGVLFDELDERVGEGRWVVAFSSDHGVVPVPEVIAEPDKRVGLEEIICLRRVVHTLGDLYDTDLWLDAPTYLDHSAVEAAGATPRSVGVELAEQLGYCPHVRRVWTLVELLEDWAEGGGEGSDNEAEKDTGAEPPRAEPGSEAWFEALYRNSVDPERSPDVFIQWEEGFLPALGPWTAHGSPYPYDTHVPLLFAGPGIEVGERRGTVLTVDVAPTLAGLVGVPVPEDLDGRNLLGQP